jgi:hypothetical protein
MNRTAQPSPDYFGHAMLNGACMGLKECQAVLHGWSDVVWENVVLALTYWVAVCKQSKHLDVCRNMVIDFTKRAQTNTIMKNRKNHLYLSGACTGLKECQTGYCSLALSSSRSVFCERLSCVIRTSINPLEWGPNNLSSTRDGFKGKACSRLESTLGLKEVDTDSRMILIGSVWAIAQVFI